jgi:hypothetical protein
MIFIFFSSSHDLDWFKIIAVRCSPPSEEEEAIDPSRDNDVVLGSRLAWRPCSISLISVLEVIRKEK